MASDQPANELLNTVNGTPKPEEPPKLNWLGKPGGQYAIRLIKPLFDAEKKEYFQEYEKLGDLPDPSKTVFKSKRYIIPEDTAYAIEITLKKGFTFGGFTGIGFRAIDFASGNILGKRFFMGETPMSILESDQVRLVDCLNAAAIGGMRKDNVSLTFQELVNDEDLSNETDVPGITPKSLGGIKFELYKRGECKYERYPPKLYERLEKEYTASLKVVPTKVDEKSWSKHGITHHNGAIGGVEVGRVAQPKLFGRYHHSDHHVEFISHFRSQEFIHRDENLLYPSPISQECYSWNSLKEHERAVGFKALQIYDKEHTLLQAIATACPGSDPKIIQRELLELGDAPNRWRTWTSLYKREREGLFKELQIRRRWFEKGEYPPDPRLAGNSKQTRFVLDQDGRSKKESKCEIQNEIVEANALSIKPIISNKSIEVPTLHPASTMKQAIIILNSDDEEPSPQNAKRPRPVPSPAKQSTIKIEVIDLESPSTPHIEEPVTKKIKLEPVVAPEPERQPTAAPEPTKTEEDLELLRLKEEDLREEEELFAAQRAAEAAMNVSNLIRLRNQRKMKIAALEAKGSPSPAPQQAPH